MTAKVTFATPASAAVAATYGSHSGTKSVASTDPSGPTRSAASTATTPLPVAISSTRAPGSGETKSTSVAANGRVFGAASRAKPSTRAAHSALRCWLGSFAWSLLATFPVSFASRVTDCSGAFDIVVGTPARLIQAHGACRPAPSYAS
jgi:hypothetical protein